MIIDGKAIAEAVSAKLAARCAARKEPVVLGILIAGNDPVTEQFVRAKSRAAARIGIEIARRELPENAATVDVIGAIRELAPDVNGIIVQLPLPEQIDVDAVLSEVPPEKDVEAINPRYTGERLVHEPVAVAIQEVLRRAGVAVSGKHAAVIGAGRLVGKPAAELLDRLGAQVSIYTVKDDLTDLHDADIIVSGAGSPGLIQPAMVKEGGVLIDAGTSEAAGNVVGDSDPACAENASVFTPVPGGLGPIVVAMLFKNLLDLVDLVEKK